MSVDARVPWVTVKDLIWIGYLGVLRPLWRWCPRVLADWLGGLVITGYAWVRRDAGLRAARRMEESLGLGRAKAEDLGQRFLRHGARRAVGDLQAWESDELRVVGGEELAAARKAGNGVMLVGVHTFAGRPAKRALAARGLKILTVRMRQEGPFGRVGRRVVGARYEQFLKSVMPDSTEAGSADGAMTVLRRLREGGLVHITIDGPISSKTELLTFLGHPWRFSSGALELARASRSPVIPFLAVYEARGIEVRFGPPLPAGAGLAGAVAALEAQIAADPSHWEMWEEL